MHFTHWAFVLELFPLCGLNLCTVSAMGEFLHGALFRTEADGGTSYII